MLLFVKIYFNLYKNYFTEFALILKKSKTLFTLDKNFYDYSTNFI